MASPFQSDPPASSTRKIRAGIDLVDFRVNGKMYGLPPGLSAVGTLSWLLTVLYGVI